MDQDRENLGFVRGMLEGIQVQMETLHGDVRRLFESTEALNRIMTSQVSKMTTMDQRFEEFRADVRDDIRSLRHDIKAIDARVNKVDGQLQRILYMAAGAGVAGSHIFGAVNKFMEWFK